MNESTDAETAAAATTGAGGTGSAGAEYVPSSSERVRDQVARYEATGGAEGGELGGLPVVILTTTGSRSGKTRKNPVMRVEQDGVYAAIASYAGNAENPQWYYNLIAHPYATVQDGSQIRRVRAREVFDEEKQTWWAVADALNPNYARYRSTAGRDIPVLALEPAEWADEVG
jgi:deazaflavin-dependent oxidoreductase (nitroreductase family)